MPNFMLTYLGTPSISTPEEKKLHMQKYHHWITGLGDAALSPMNPLKNVSVVDSDGEVTTGGETGMSGFTIVSAESMEAALVIVKACPFLEVGGRLEVAEMIEMG
ncbi:MAG: hypothetical protein ACI854_000465 [Arenicella sp.]|jgi:hypothetical protein